MSPSRDMHDTPHDASPEARWQQAGFAGDRESVGSHGPAGGGAVRRRLQHEPLTQHLDRLFRAAVVMTGSHADAEDLVQETYLRVMRRPRFLHGDNEIGYLMRTMRNTWLNTCRSRVSEARAVQESAARLERQSEPDPLLSVQTRAVLAAVSKLPPFYRDAIAAVDVLGLSYKDAAKALGTREGTVMSRVFRARVQVGRALGDQGDAMH